MDERMKTEGAAPQGKTPEFTLSQLMRTKRFSWMERCVLEALLDGERAYTIAEAKAAIADFMKKEVV